MMNRPVHQPVDVRFRTGVPILRRSFFRGFPAGLAILLVLARTASLSGERTNIAGLGMGRTAVASSRGLDAVGINPANLVARDGATVTVSLLPVGMNVGSDVLSYDLYNQYFTGVETDSGRVGRYLTDQDKQRILERFTDGVGHGTVDFETRALGVSLAFETVGTFAFTISDRIAATGTLPRQYAQFLLYGNPPGSSYDFSKSAAQASWLRDYSLSFAMRLPGLPFLNAAYAGASVKVIHGFSYFVVERFNSRLTTSPDGVLDGSIDTYVRRAGYAPGSSDFTPFPAPGGTGLGFDLGVAADLNEFLRAGLSVTDIGSITWKNGLVENVAYGTIHLDNPLDPAQRDSVKNAVTGEERDGTEFSSALPTTLRLGAAVELHKIDGLKHLIYGELLVAADYTQGLTDAAGTSLTPRLSVGMQYSPWKFLPLRLGASFWGREGASLGFGFGLRAGFFELDLASESMEWVFNPGSFSRGAFAMGMKFKF